MNLIIVFTPFQLMCAKNYCLEFNETARIIVLSSSKKIINQIELQNKQTHLEYPLRKILFIENNIMWLIKMLYVQIINIKNYNKIIIGSYNNLPAYYLALRFMKLKKEIILLDDGFATLSIYSDRNQKNILKKTKMYGGKLTRLIMFLYPTLKKKSISKLTFYTIYKLEKIIKPVYDNVYEFSLKKIENTVKIDDKLVWFIGQPLVNLKILNEIIHKEIVSNILDLCKKKNKKLIYILHRNEKPYEDLDIEYLKFNVSLESIVVNDSLTLPKPIVSFYSSALLNLKLMNNNINSYYIENETLKGNYKILELYNYFKKSSILELFKEEKI